MPLTGEQSKIWQAMNIGPQWILRDSADPLLVENDPPGVHSIEKKEPPAAAPVTKPRAVSRPEPIPEEFPVRAPVRKKPTPQTYGEQPQIVVNDALMQEVATAPWEALPALINQCRGCALASTRTRTVPSDGAPGCPIVIIGEAPGRDEDIEGIPFVGKSGQLLTNLLGSMNLERGKDVAIVNVLKCRPPNNRDPQPQEVSACAGFLNRQLELLDPKVLVLMGRHAVQRILDDDTSIGRLRTKSHHTQINGHDVPVIVTYHPSYLLRSPVEKEKTWQDLIRAKRLMQGG